MDTTPILYFRLYNPQSAIPYAYHINCIQALDVTLRTREMRDGVATSIRKPFFGDLLLLQSFIWRRESA